MLVLKSGLLLRLDDIIAIKKIVIEDIKCYRLEIFYAISSISFDYLSEEELISDYDLIFKSLQENNS